MKEIYVGKGMVSKVDDEDFQLLNSFMWYAQKGHNTYYARRSFPSDGVLMHRLLMGVTDKDVKVDHIGHDGLDNQRHNLRIGSVSQNSSNKRPRKESSSKYLGVHWNKHAGIWRAHIKKGNISRYLGSFEIEEEAALAYDIAAIKIHGKFANLNFK